MLFGLGAAAKLWPLFILGPILIVALRTGRLRPFFGAFLATGATWLLVNLPVMVFWHESWLRFFRLNSERPVDWGTFWYIGRYLDGKWNAGTVGDQGPFQWLSDHIPTLNYLSYALFGLSCVGILLLGLLAPRRPRISQLAFLVVAAFLIFSKVWSQQYVLWLLPLIALARPKWGAVIAWSLAEVAYLAAFYAELIGAGGKTVIPEGTFVLASTFRLVTVAVLFFLVAREIWRPELDDVRRSYGGADPDAGKLDGPEAPWLTGFRGYFRMGPSQEAPVLPDEPSPAVQLR
ncbi:putative membrane protein [Actinoplanes campanulatus]|uniref:Putative membrane protein n=1 Tax=Actinoplanes campanulatus TaxID=113559 RepID=A0A7W5AQA3_9ACTN|nr:putative membrane protein [Actinoplanes campanulatus]GGN25127.1 hypothetical protein GCM10010109_41130 [Actinoplanes campanulatus]GID39476.1 hypothetical protein Aca09nite_59820 [Actinoplanes campanulatus]